MGHVQQPSQATHTPVLHAVDKRCHAARGKTRLRQQEKSCATLIEEPEPTANNHQSVIG